MWYLLAASLFFLPFHLRTSLAVLAVTLIVALIDGTLQLQGLVALALIAFVAVYRSHYARHSIAGWAAECLLLASALALMLHFIPGFNNYQVVQSVQAGPESAPFSFWYNLDKALIPFVLLGCLPTLLKRSAVAPDNKLWWLVLVLAMPVLLLSAVLAGGLRVELHYPEWLGPFMLANLFFVSMAEEALFRGYLQQRLSQWLGNVWGLLIAALLFGLAHHAGGPLLMFFAGLTGILYGLAWLWSGRVWVATLVHFAFNMLHVLFFTYPVWQHP